MAKNGGPPTYEVRPTDDLSTAGYLQIDRLRRSHHLLKHHEIPSTFRIHHRGNSPRVVIPSSQIWNLKIWSLPLLSDALISLIPIYGPWIIFSVVAFESAGVPLPGETILVGAALLAA